MDYSRAMNANEISPKACSRINRIQKVSAFLRTFFFTCALIFWVLGVICFLNPHCFSEDHWKILLLGYAVESCFACKLFSAYARGDLFASNVVRYVRWIGITTVLIGIGNICITLFTLQNNGWFRDAFSSAAGIIGCLEMIFLQVVLNLIPGFVIIFIAWIMDEGRKIQEEQELTV